MDAKVRSAQQEIAVALESFFDNFTAREAEDVLFQVFGTAEIHSDGVHEVDKSDRMLLHGILRDILFQLYDDNVFDFFREKLLIANTE